MTEPSERDREMAQRFLGMHPSDEDRENLAAIIATAREEGRRDERARCAAWAKLYWDGDLSDEYAMYVGIRDGTEPPLHLKWTALLIERGEVNIDTDARIRSGS
jgi:hypothetical protein